MIRTNVKKASSDNRLIMAASKFESAVTASMNDTCSAWRVNLITVHIALTQ